MVTANDGDGEMLGRERTSDDNANCSLGGGSSCSCRQDVGVEPQGLARSITPPLIISPPRLSPAARLRLEHALLFDPPLERQPVPHAHPQPAGARGGASVGQHPLVRSERRRHRVQMLGAQLAQPRSDSAACRRGPADPEAALVAEAAAIRHPHAVVPVVAFDETVVLKQLGIVVRVVGEEELLSSAHVLQRLDLDRIRPEPRAQPKRDIGLRSVVVEGVGARSEHVDRAVGPRERRP
eukprot:5357736-Prymnesium_polylepis.3